MEFPTGLFLHYPAFKSNARETWCVILVSESGLRMSALLSV
ncbi:hypothetical protein HMPREF0373_02993 [Eubacterium ramulus ATCC 29099]|uniref:Uncharacterized protein n=1 Tax=Eubacterium ramulus ATCC 29099 TaxID=1256908 RepID=U2QU99_EUBRA|nr:hypothetical protein HMPREF0373_02993 [Eubacterium ramulus ATCC 29099]